jgi:heme-degrading monooxygenase HmoA
MFVVIFEVHPAEGKRDDYLAHAKELKPEVEAIDGFIDNERFENRLRPGWVLSLSTWRDEKSVIRWRRQTKHHFTQEKGRSGIFSDYWLRVGEITADTHPPMPVREMRFDVTETGLSKACTITELTPVEGQDVPRDNDALLVAAGLERQAAGLNGFEIFDSIYTLGKVLVLALWTAPENAGSMHPTTMPGMATARLRRVRVIREYGMFDRHETPQFYPDVRRTP